MWKLLLEGNSHVFEVSLCFFLRFRRSRNRNIHSKHVSKVLIWCFWENSGNCWKWNENHSGNTNYTKRSFTGRCRDSGAVLVHALWSWKRHKSEQRVLEIIKRGENTKDKSIATSRNFAWIMKEKLAATPLSSFFGHVYRVKTDRANTLGQNLKRVSAFETHDHN